MTKTDAAFEKDEQHRLEARERAWQHRQEADAIRRNLNVAAGRVAKLTGQVEQAEQAVAPLRERRGHATKELSALRKQGEPDGHPHEVDRYRLRVANLEQEVAEIDNPVAALGDAHTASLFGLHRGLSSAERLIATLRAERAEWQAKLDQATADLVALDD